MFATLGDFHIPPLQLQQLKIPLRLQIGTFLQSMQKSNKENVRTVLTQGIVWYIQHFHAKTEEVKKKRGMKKLCSETPK